MEYEIIVINGKEVSEEECIRELKRAFPKITDEHFNMAMELAYCCEHSSINELYWDAYGELMNRYESEEE